MFWVTAKPEFSPTRCFGLAIFIRLPQPANAIIFVSNFKEDMAEGNTGFQISSPDDYIFRRKFSPEANFSYLKQSFEIAIPAVNFTPYIYLKKDMPRLKEG